MEIFHISAECYPVAKVGGLMMVGALQNIKTMQDICKSRYLVTTQIQEG
jgi:glycogen synthase